MKYHDLLLLARRGVNSWLKANGIEFFTLTFDSDHLDKKVIKFLRNKGICIQSVHVGTDTYFTIVGKQKIKANQLEHIEDAWIILHERPDKCDLERVAKKLKPWLSNTDLNLLRREHERQRRRHR